jgi:hypothetical protein
MRMLAAVVVILALPALVMADINRLKLSPDLDPPDALPWSARRTEPSLRAVPVGMPVWVAPSVPLVPRCCKNEVPGPCTAPQYVTRCQCKPDIADRAVAPILWPHSPRTDERNTLTKEQRLAKGCVQDSQPVN